MRFVKQVSHGGPKRARDRPKQQGPRYLLETSENDQGDEACDQNRPAGEAETGTVGLPRRASPRYRAAHHPTTTTLGKQHYLPVFFHSAACPSF
jgi:hypothetical protein